MYPTPCRLYSLKTEAGLSNLQERELDSWLEQLSFKRKKDFFNYEDVPAWRGALMTDDVSIHLNS